MRIEQIRFSLEPFLEAQGTNRLSALSEFIQLDFLAFAVAKNLDDYEKLVSKLPLSELVKFSFYEGLKNA